MIFDNNPIAILAAGSVATVALSWIARKLRTAWDRGVKAAATQVLAEQNDRLEQEVMNPKPAASRDWEEWERRSESQTSLVVKGLDSCLGAIDGALKQQHEDSQMILVALEANFREAAKSRKEFTAFVRSMLGGGAGGYQEMDDDEIELREEVERLVRRYPGLSREDAVVKAREIVKYKGMTSGV